MRLEKAVILVVKLSPSWQWLGGSGQKTEGDVFLFIFFFLWLCVWSGVWLLLGSGGLVVGGCRWYRWMRLETAVILVVKLLGVWQWLGGNDQ
jgi:hypothetical protein